jgi:hypothetical protein
MPAAMQSWIGMPLAEIALDDLGSRRRVGAAALPPWLEGCLLPGLAFS